MGAEKLRSIAFPRASRRRRDSSINRRRQRLARPLQPDLGADRFQGLDAGRHKVAVAINEAVQLPEQGRGFFVVQDLDDDYSRR